MPTKEKRDQTAGDSLGYSVRNPSAETLEALRAVLGADDDEALNNAVRAVNDVVNAAVAQLQRAVEDLLRSEETQRLIADLFEQAVDATARRASESRPKRTRRGKQVLAVRASTISEAFLEGLGDLIELFPDPIDPLLGLHKATPLRARRARRGAPRGSVEDNPRDALPRNPERSLG